MSVEKDIMAWANDPEQQREKFDAERYFEGTELAERIKADSKAEIAVAIGLAIYARMVRLSQNCGQTVGEKNEYYVTLRQLEDAFINM